MTQGQIAQLQDLSKCYMRRKQVKFVDSWLNFSVEEDRMGGPSKTYLRTLTHLYRHQIAAVKRNQSATFRTESSQKQPEVAGRILDGM